MYSVLKKLKARTCCSDMLIIIIIIIIITENNGNFTCVFECTIVNLATYRQFTNAA